MRKKVFGKQLSRNRKSRKALFISLTRELLINGSIKTTEAKAKAVEPMVNKLVTLVRKNDLSSRRKVEADLGNDREAAKKIFELFSKTKSTSGFTKITKLLERKGDMAKMVRIELIGMEIKEEEPRTRASTAQGKEKKQ